MGQGQGSDKLGPIYTLTLDKLSLFAHLSRRRPIHPADDLILLRGGEAGAEAGHGLLQLLRGQPPGVALVVGSEDLVHEGLQGRKCISSVPEGGPPVINVSWAPHGELTCL